MGNGLNSELDFEKRISEMPDNELLRFIARQTYEITGKCKTFDSEINLLKTGDRKVSGIMGGMAGMVTSVIIGIINYFTVNRS